MRRPVCCMALVFFFMVLLSGSFSVFADGLIVHNGATLTLNGSTLDLNCLDLTIESGGTFEFASGIVTDCGNLIVDVGGSLIEGTGTIDYCQATLPPTATTQAATSVTSSSATLNGTVNPNSLPTTYYFEYGPSTSYSSSTPEADAGSGGEEVAVAAQITVPDPIATYHYRLVAYNSAGTSYGQGKSFTNDTDADLMPDDWEEQHGLNPNVNDASQDPDRDGLTNLQEYQNNTDPQLKDTDGDGMPDGWEVQYNLDPLVDDASLDPDKDGYTNLQEYKEGGDPHNPATPFPWELFYPAFIKKR